MDPALKGWKYFRKHFPSLTGYDGMTILEQISVMNWIVGMYINAKSDLLERNYVKWTRLEIQKEIDGCLENAGYRATMEDTLKHFWNWEPGVDYKPLQDGYNHDPEIQALFKKKRKK